MTKRSGFTAPNKETDKQQSGLGVTVGLGEVGGLEVKGVVEVDISPLNADINYDVSSNELGVNGEIGLPGNAVSVGGGLIIDLDTGQVTGGSASLGFGGAEVEVSISQCERTLQITYWGVGFAVSEDTCKKEDEDSGDDFDFGIPKPPNVPKPNLGDIPVGYTGWICPVYEAKSKTKHTWGEEFVVRNRWGEEWLRGYPVALDFQLRYTKVGEVPMGALSRWDNRYKISLIWSVSEGTFTIREGTPKEETTILPLGYNFKSTTNSFYYHPKTQSPPSLKYFLRLEGGYYSESMNLDLKKYTGLQPCYYVKNYYPITTNKRRPIPPEIMDKQCCDASVSMLRKIMKVLAVDTILTEDENKKISTQTIETYKQNYNNLVQQLPEGQKPKIYFNDYLNLKIYELATGDNTKLQDIAKVLGVEAGNSRFPFSMPSSFRNIDGNEPQNKEIDDYPEAFGYLLDRIDELIGQFDIEIEIEDTDPTTQGNQSQKIKIGNISEGIAEIIGLIFGLGISTKIGSEAAVKSLITLGMMQRVMTEIDAVTEELLDHFEVPIKETTREIDLEFTPGAKNFEHFFKPSKESVKIVERLMDKKHPTVQDQMEILLQAAEIIKSRGFRKVNPHADIAAQVVGGLATGLLDKYVLNNNEASTTDKDSEFEDFIKDVQENFRDYEKPEEIDLEKSDNPKIVKLNKPTAPTNPTPNS